MNILMPFCCWHCKQSSFLWGYLMSPIIGGALVDYYGGKRVMAYGVALWSLATFLSPWAAGRSIWLFLFTRILLGLAEGVALPTSQAWTTWCWGIYLCNIIPFDYFISNFFRTKTYCCLAVGISAKIYVSVCIGPFITGGFLAQRDLVLWVLQWLAFSLAMPLGYFFPQLSCHELESLDLSWYLDYSDFCGCWCGYRLYLAHQVNMHRYQHMNWSI